MKRKDLDRRRVAATAVLAAAMSALGSWPTAAGQDYVISAAGWRYEQFGDDVTILQARTSSDPPPAGELGLFISCAGAERRLRLTFPAPQGAGVLRAVAGLALIRPADRSSEPGVLMSFTVLDNSVALFVEGPRKVGSAMSALVRMLGGAARGLDIVHTSEAGAALGRLQILRLQVRSQPGDGLVFQEVARACGLGSRSGME